MAHDAVWAGAYQFMIGIQRRIETKLTAESARGGPGQETRKRQKHYRADDPRKGGRARPKWISEQQQIRYGFEDKTPARAWLLSDRRLGAPAGQRKWKEPNKPAGGAQDVYGRREVS